MSLSVYLSRRRLLSYDEGKTHIDDNEELYWANITHNLVKMADQTVLYLAIWNPTELLKANDKHKVEVKAKDIIPHLEIGLSQLKKDPFYYQKFNPKNGWGNYEVFVSFVGKYLNACKEYPESDVRVSS
jgi:hypothetical protein